MFKGEGSELSEIKCVLVDRDMIRELSGKLRFPILTSHLDASSHVL